MPFIERAAFPIKPQSIPPTDEEEALCSSSRGEEENSTLLTNLTKTEPQEKEAASFFQSLLDRTTTEEEVDDNWDVSSNVALLKKIMNEMKQMQRKHEDLEEKMEQMRRRNEELEQKLPEEIKRVMRVNEIDTQQQGASTAEAADSRPSGDSSRTNLLHRSSSSFVRSTLNIDSNGEQHFSLPKDTFSLMIVSKPFSGPWLLGLMAYAIQMSLFILLSVELFRKKGGILSQLPSQPGPMVRYAQVLVLVVIFILQSDLVEATRCLFVLEGRHKRYLAFGGRDTAAGDDSSNVNVINTLPILARARFDFPNLLKLSMALVTIVTSVFVTVQSGDILELLKDFSALMIVNQIDNSVLTLFIANGLCGLDAKKKADEVMTRSVKVEVVDSSTTLSQEDDTSSIRGGRCCNKRTRCFIKIGTMLLIIVLLVVIIMAVITRGITLTEGVITLSLEKSIISIAIGCTIVVWVTEMVLCRGSKGTLFMLIIYMMALAIWIAVFIMQYRRVIFMANHPECKVYYPSSIGDGECDGGDYNTEECGWDGGDCDEFNEKYPNCKADTPYWIGDGRCDKGAYNTVECGWDGGDCDLFNENYPNCKVVYPSKIGDGSCDGGDYNTEECGWDGGDCDEFNEKYPNCTAYSPDWIGNGWCDWGDFNTEECGWDGGDCLN